MSTVITMTLEDQAIERIECLARLRRVTRDEMLARILHTGLLHEELHARELPTPRPGGAR